MTLPFRIPQNFFIYQESVDKMGNRDIESFIFIYIQTLNCNIYGIVKKKNGIITLVGMNKYHVFFTLSNNVYGILKKKKKKKKGRITFVGICRIEFRVLPKKKKKIIIIINS